MATLSVPAAARIADAPTFPFFEDVPGNSRFPRVEKIYPPGSVFSSCQPGQGADVRSLELLEHDSLPGTYFPQKATLRLVANAAERLQDELKRLGQWPRAVHVCPASDPFPLPLEVQHETAHVVDVLCRHGIQAWLTTRGWIRQPAWQVLCRHKELVKVRIGLTTLDRSLGRILEPGAASPSHRLRQIHRMQAMEIPVQVALEPLLPDLTDTRQNLCAVLEALASAGVRHLTAGYLTMPVGSEESWRDILEPQAWDGMVLDAFSGGPLLPAGRRHYVRYLPKVQRQRGYALLITLAASLGINVSISAASNPDFARPASGASIVQPRLRFLNDSTRQGA
jgi:DNA repair photolyase